MHIKQLVYLISILPAVGLVSILLWVGSLDAPQSQSPYVLHDVHKESIEITPEVAQEGEITREQVEVKEEKMIVRQGSIHHVVPFTSQAPTFAWSDIRQQNACEEASALMAMAWVTGEELPDADGIVKKLLAIDAYEEVQYDAHLDTSAADAIEYIFKGYFEYSNVSLENVDSIDDIVTALQTGVVIIPADGQKLNNPHFTNGGPERHMLLIIGYDAETDEFITNDPGTQFGKDYRYSSAVLYNAIQDYETGYHVPIVEKRKVMIVVEK